MKELFYIPIRTLSNIIPLNQRFRELFTAVNDIIARLNAIEGITEAETVADTDSQTVVINEAPEIVADEFIDAVEVVDQVDPDEAIRAQGKELGIRSAHNMGIELLKSKIKDVLELGE